MLATQMMHEVEKFIPPASAVTLRHRYVSSDRCSQMDSFGDLIIYEADDLELPERIINILSKFGCRIVQQHTTPTYFFSGTETFKCVLTMDMDRCDQEKFWQWYDGTSPMFDMDFTLHGPGTGR